MAGFKSPNYTQIPNDLLDNHLPEMGYAELKVVLFLCRKTFGYHRGQARVSIRKIAKATGLSSRRVQDGVEKALTRGVVTKSTDGGVTLWGVVVASTVNPESVDVMTTPSIKEKEIKKSDTDEKTIGESKNQFPMMEVIANVCNLNLKMNGGKLGVEAKKLNAAGYCPEQILKAYQGDKSWWNTVDWRGKQGQRPNIATINETVKEAVHGKVKRKLVVK